MTSRRPTRANLVLYLGWLSVLPLLVWWLGWFPGFLSSDSVDQMGQVARFDFYNFHPIFHTFSLWLVTSVWDNAGAITLVQVVVLAGLLGLVARRLTQVGVPWWLSVGVVWVAAALPMVATMTITVWKDVPYTLAMVWAFTELLLLARDRDRFWGSFAGPLRLGSALGLVWAFRPNGKITVILLIVALAIGFRHRWKSLLVTFGAVIGVGVVVPAALLVVLPVHAGTIEPAEVFMSDVASVVVHDPDWFDTADLELIEAVGPLEVWNSEYKCTDSSPLIFHPDFDTSAARGDPWTYRSLVARSVLTHIPIVAGHRLCAASYLFWPVQPADVYLHRPPFEIPPNTLGIARTHLSWRAYEATFAQYQWTEQDSHFWFTWRPALMILAGIATYAAIAFRRRLRPLLWAGALIAAQLVNVAATTPAQEFRYAFGLYLLSLLSLPLWWLVIRPSASRVAMLLDEQSATDQLL